MKIRQVKKFLLDIINDFDYTEKSLTNITPKAKFSRGDSYALLLTRLANIASTSEHIGKGADRQYRTGFDNDKECPEILIAKIKQEFPELSEGVL